MFRNRFVLRMFLLKCLLGSGVCMASTSELQVEPVEDIAGSQGAIIKKISILQSIRSPGNLFIARYVPHICDLCHFYIRDENKPLFPQIESYLEQQGIKEIILSNHVAALNGIPVRNIKIILQRLFLIFSDRTETVESEKLKSMTFKEILTRIGSAEISYALSVAFYK